MGHGPRGSESPSDCLSLLVVPTRGVTREARDAGHPAWWGAPDRHQAGAAEPSGEDGLAHGEHKARTTDLIVAFGWKKSNMFDLGDITAARGMEMILPIWIRLRSALKTPNFNFHIAVGPQPAK